MEKETIRISILSIIINLLLSCGKLAAGIIGHSAAMVSDAIHSASDVFSTIILIIGVRISSKSADEQHPYGHERMECIAAILLAVILAITGGTIGYDGLIKITSGEYKTLMIPGMMAVIAAIISILVKEVMYRYTISYAKKTNSAALKADAWHHRSDAFSSIGALVGIVFARAGFPVMDAVASLIICVLILKTALEIFKEAADKVVDRSAGSEVEENIKDVIYRNEHVKGISKLRTRMFGAKLYLDVEIEVDGTMVLKDAHTVAEQVHRDVEYVFPEIKHCMVHVNPV